jgi:hypothetical protein
MFEEKLYLMDATDGAVVISGLWMQQQVGMIHGFL